MKDRLVLGFSLRRKKGIDGEGAELRSVDVWVLEMMHHSGVSVIRYLCTPVSEICAQSYCTIYIAYFRDSPRVRIILLASINCHQWDLSSHVDWEKVE